MPLIPGINQPEVKANAVNTPYFSVKAAEDEFGGNIGKSMLDLGKDLGDDADAIAKLRPKDTKKTTDPGGTDQNSTGGEKQIAGVPSAGSASNADVSNAIDRVNGFNGAALQLQSDFFGLSGKAAVDAKPDVLDRLSQLQSDALTGAASPQSASLAQLALAKWGPVLAGNLERHADAQQRVYDNDLDNTQIEQSRDAAGLLYDDDQNFLLQLQVAAQARADQVERQMTASGSPFEESRIATAVADAKAAVASDLVAKRVAGAVEQGDIPGAMNLHLRWQRDLLPQDNRLAVELISAADFVARIGGETNRILTYGKE